MALTPETLVRHELVGLDVAVVGAADPTLVGVTGEAVLETTRILGIDTGEDVVQVPKATVTLEWTLPSGERVRVAGETLLGRPARRTEQRSDSTWR